MSDRGEPPVALSIAGSDSGAGAGLQADLKTMGALGVFGTTAVTAVTAQNTVTVGAVQLLGADMVRSQIEAVLDDLPVAAVKTGMLGTAEVVEEIGRWAATGRLPRLVVDPVMVASTGRLLLAQEGIDSYRRVLLPHALVATPNLWEAAILAGVEPTALRDVDDMIEVARRLHKLGSRWVLIKGGHLPGVATHDRHPAPARVSDVLFDGQAVSVLEGSHVETPNTHGTGCSLSAAIAARLAQGDDVPAAVAAAKQFVHGALTGGAGWRLGAGHGPLDHLGWNRNGPDGVGPT